MTIFYKVNRSADMRSIAEIKTLKFATWVTNACNVSWPLPTKELKLSKPAKFVGKIYEGFTRRRMKGFCESITVLSS
jgi:hypothetical protein